MLDVIVQLGDRNVIDCTETVRLLHHEHLRIGGSKTWYDALQAGVTGVYVNRHLGYREIDGLETKNQGVKYHWTFGTSFGTPYYSENDAAGQTIMMTRKVRTIECERANERTIEASED